MNRYQRSEIYPSSQIKYGARSVAILSNIVWRLKEHRPPQIHIFLVCRMSSGTPSLITAVSSREFYRRHSPSSRLIQLTFWCSDGDEKLNDCFFGLLAVRPWWDWSFESVLFLIFQYSYNSDHLRYRSEFSDITRTGIIFWSVVSVQVNSVWKYPWSLGKILFLWVGLHNLEITIDHTTSMLTPKIDSLLWTGPCSWNCFRCE